MLPSSAIRLPGHRDRKELVESCCKTSSCNAAEYPDSGLRMLAALAELQRQAGNLESRACAAGTRLTPPAVVRRTSAHLCWSPMLTRLALPPSWAVRLPWPVPTYGVDGSPLVASGCTLDRLCLAGALPVTLSLISVTETHRLSPQAQRRFDGGCTPGIRPGSVMLFVRVPAEPSRFTSW